MRRILKSYLKRLTNLTSANKSLLLSRLTGEQFLDIHEVDFLLNTPSFDIIKQLIARKSAIPLCETQDSRYDKVNEASKKLKKIARTEKFIEEERGARDLYVGYPFVRGKLADGTLVRAPLLFFPVSLHRPPGLVQTASQAARWTLFPREDESISLNRSFLLAYSHFNGVTLPDELLETNFEEFDKDSLAFRTQLYEVLKASSLEINFNKESFVDQLQAFVPFKKDELEEAERNGELKLYPEAVLGIFPQAGSYLVPDYEFLLEQMGEEDDFSELFGRGMAALQPVKEEHVFAPFPIDASQESALRAIKQGRSMVIQGPPGTGKSQLICNLITDFTARGKRVLMVCQKRAALDVVYERLTRMGMGDFVALIHDFQNDRKALYTQIDNQLEKLDAYKQQNHGLDAIFMERSFLQESRRIDQLAEELQEFKNALFDEEECGISVKELYLTSDLSKPFIALSEYKKFDFRTLGDFQQKLAAYTAYAYQLEHPAYRWKERVSFSRFSLSDQAAIEETIHEIPVFEKKLKDMTVALVGAELTIGQGLKILKEDAPISELLEVMENEEQWLILQMLLQTNYQMPTDLQWLLEMEQKILSCLTTGVEQTLPLNQLESFETKLDIAKRARPAVFTWYYWLFFSKDKEWIKSVISANGLTLEEADLVTLAERTNNRIRLESLLREARNRLFLPALPDMIDAAHYKRIFHNHQQAFKAYGLFETTKFLSENTLVVQQTSLANFKLNTSRLLTQLRTIPQMLQKWRMYLTEEQIELILLKPQQGPELIRILRDDFELLCESDRLKESFTHIQLDVTERLLAWAVEEAPATSQSGEKMTEVVLTLFQNSLRMAWIEHIELLYPVLRSVSSHKLRQTEKELQDSVRKKQGLSKDILLLKLREKTYEDLEFNRLNNAVTYRELKHQTTKKRKIWPVRKLMSELSEEVFNLVPCWMASPESVSAIFPMHAPVEQPEDAEHAPLPEPLFDLVIFDEASQCFAENGIPAMYRGKQVVITGDSKQLSPSDLYRVRFEEEVDDDRATAMELEVDSLLDLAAQHLEQTQLKGHYRSKSLDLIDFSNQHFYRDTLQLLPDYKEINKNEPAIRYLKVDGIWANNVNEAEAAEVVQLVENLLAEFPDKELGIVTFNFKQQTLIQDLLEERAIEKQSVLPDSLFVKNIENVQGDERDIIIFSVGYAPDAKGKLVMRFGSLNAQNGENRLNVAVTRAREKIYVVSSILPPQLHTEDTAHQGPKLLKKYLEYALLVSKGHYRPRPKATEQYRTEWMLKNKLSSGNPQLRKELPFADLTIKNDEEYQALILTDDDLYHQSISPKEAHVYTPFALQAKNWQFKRMYSREYWRSRAPK